MASPPAFDIPEFPVDVVAVMMDKMRLEERFTCALVCSDWATTAADTAHSIVKRDVRDLTGLEQWLEKHGSQIETMQLHMCHTAGMARLPCTQLQDLLLHGKGDQDRDRRLTLDSRVWSDIAAATNLTSVSLELVRTDSQQEVVVSALTALPDLQQLIWRAVQCGQKQELSDSRLLQQLTKLTSLDVRAVSAEALQHLGSLSKLQHLNISAAPEWDAAKCPGLQLLTGLTSLRLGYFSQGLPSAVSHLTALQQLEVSAAKFPGLQLLTGLTSLRLGYRSQGLPSAVNHLTALLELEVSAASPTELNGLKALTALTKLDVARLKHDATPLLLPGLQQLDLQGVLGELHMSQLSSCTQLRRLTLRRLCLVGPDSLVASSMLQELHLRDCKFSSPGGAACVDPWQLVFPGAGCLPHLTSLVLHAMPRAPRQADLKRLVACCSGLRRLRVFAVFPTLPLNVGIFRNAPAFECLNSLMTLQLSTVNDTQCSSLAKLTGLQELEVMYPDHLSRAGLKHLARLQQLTSLSFVHEFDPHKVSAVLQAQLSDRVQGSSCALVNKAPLGSPPDVSARLLHACNMAAGGRQQ